MLINSKIAVQNEGSVCSDRKGSVCAEYPGYYNMANFDHTYISSTLSYQKNNDGTSVGLAFNRPFYSPLAKWAGGFSIGKSWKYFSYTDSIDGTEKKMPLNNSGYDVWVGKSFKINSKRSFFNQSTNIFVGERYYTNVYDKRPNFSIDDQRLNLGSSSFVGNIGLSVQQFYKVNSFIVLVQTKTFRMD